MAGRWLPRETKFIKASHEPVGWSIVVMPGRDIQGILGRPTIESKISRRE
jgi:hypothetical protein